LDLEFSSCVLRKFLHHEFHNVLPSQEDREVILWLEPDLTLHLSYREVLLLKEVDLSLDGELRDSIRSIEVIHQPHFDVSLDLVLDAVNHSLKHGYIPDFGAISVELNVDLQLISFAILVDIVVKHSELRRQSRSVLG